MKKITFCFTRHGYSCNNINITYGEKTINSDSDPAISTWAILETFNNGKKNMKYYNSNIIYVSCLVRTWMTATLLYIHYANKFKKNNLILNIVPYLKELHNTKLLKSLDIGNYPNSIFNQINSYYRFLKYALLLLKNSKNIFKNLKITINMLDIYNIVFIIDSNFNINIKINYTNIENVNLIKNKMVKNNINLNINKLNTVKENSNYKKYLDNIKNKIIKNIPIINLKYTKLNINILNNKIPNIINNKLYKNKLGDSYIYDNLIFYKKNKNLDYFISWFLDNKINTYNQQIGGDNIFYKKNINNIISSRENICIHCITHSRIMQEFIISKLINPNELKKHNFYNKITDTNSWSLQININLKGEIDYNKIFFMYGIQKPELITNKNATNKFISTKKIYSIQECENLCYTKKLINKNKCNSKIKQYTKKYIKPLLSKDLKTKI
jgi:hypothetical protein